MREIKFRVWDKENEVMINWFPVMLFDNGKPYISLTSPDGIHNSQDWEYRYDMELMQYTGLKDKNGKEIFEGDVVEGIFPNNRIKSKQVVEYKTNGLHQNKYNVGSQTIGFNLWHTDYEIIGNIYENPELLQDSK